ncbi:cation:proton antiporter [Natranaerofaba carboxydovora]|uniref:cation:proton antiporter n=1 Tax=Natranaerofaba carboxydovora TaxID=2742683 RepID=UPI002402C30C|nr:cation:proton antiporter [Natranaerofaba carboxydovora]
MDGLIAVGIILLVGGIGGYVSNKINLPAVTGYIIFGLFIGPSFLNILTDVRLEEFSPFNSFALGIIAITIGYELKYDRLRQLKSQVLKSFLVESLFTVIITTLLVYILGLELRLAVLLGILAMTTSPTGVMAVLKEYNATGLFQELQYPS